MSKITIENIKEELKDTDWELLSTEYKNLDSELVFSCPEKHKVYSSWKKIREKRECPVCKNNKLKSQDTKVIRRTGSRRTLALDQSTRITGWAIYDDDKLIKYGLFTTSFDDEVARSTAIKQWLINMIQNWKPDMVALEGIQYQKNVGVTTFEMLARLQGVLMNCLYELGVLFTICPTNTWRAHCKVKGQSRIEKKRSMQMITKELFDISVTEDEADAIGIGKYAAEVKNVKPKMIQWE